MAITLEELYKKVMSDRDIMGEFVRASGKGSLSEFAGQYGCTATDSEIRNYFISACEGTDEGELDDDAVEGVAGGFDFFAWISGIFNDIFGSGTTTAATTSTTDSSRSRSSYLGGGMVEVGKAPKDMTKIVGKGIAPASVGVPKSSYLKKM